MIVGLGNTLTDVADNVNNGNFSSIPNTVFNGLLQNDGWAVLITITASYLIYRTLEKIYHGPERVSKSIKGRVKRTRRKIAEKVEGK